MQKTSLSNGKTESIVTTAMVLEDLGLHAPARHPVPTFVAWLIARVLAEHRSLSSTDMVHMQYQFPTGDRLHREIRMMLGIAMEYQRVLVIYEDIEQKHRIRDMTGRIRCLYERVMVAFNLKERARRMGQISDARIRSRQAYRSIYHLEELEALLRVEEVTERHLM